MSEIWPPSIGPQIGATSVVIDQIASAVPFLCGGKIDISSACEPGIIGPDTAPCSTRNMISEPRLQAMPHRNEAMVNASTDSTNTRTTPKRCISQPVSGTEMPLATANEVITQVPWSVDTPRLPEIVGIDTLAIVVSSTCMKVPTASAVATSACEPLTGGIAGGPAPAAALLLLPGLLTARREWRRHRPAGRHWRR